MGGTSAVIPAAGRGERLGHNRPKAFVPLDGIPLLAWSISALQASPAIDEIVVVAPLDSVDETWQLAVRFGLSKVSRVVVGAEDRQSSVLRGVEAADLSAQIILVHDAARPLVPLEVIALCVCAAREAGVSTAALSVSDTLRRGCLDGDAGEVLDRRQTVRIQTPQAVRAEILRGAWDRCVEIASSCTDDTSMIERATGISARLVTGSDLSLKVTTPADLLLAEALVKAGAGCRPSAPGDPAAGAAHVAASPKHADDRRDDPLASGTSSRNILPVAIGLGYDVHAFDASRPLHLCGIYLPGAPGLAGHSDADAALHAVCDAVLGAVGERDIGYHFPNTDETLRGVDSAALLKRVTEIAARAGWRPAALDLTVIAEQPRLAPHVDAMRRRLSELLSIPSGAISVKATTNEGLGFIGRSEGIACFALATLRPT